MACSLLTLASPRHRHRAEIRAPASVSGHVALAVIGVGRHASSQILMRLLVLDLGSDIGVVLRLTLSASTSRSRRRPKSRSFIPAGRWSPQNVVLPLEMVVSSMSSYPRVVAVRPARDGGLSII
jgi:hypothetical protein